MADLRLKRIAAAARVIAHALQDPKDLEISSINLRHGLEDDQLEVLLFLAVRALPPDVCERMLQDIFEGAGWPMPSISEDPLEDARYWAKGATEKELNRYAVACFERMTPSRRNTFLRWAEKQK